MNLQKRQLFVLMTFLFISGVIFSQFTYLDISMGNKFMNLSNQRRDFSGNTYNQTNIHLNGLWRFKRHLGVGMTASIPIRQGGKYSIRTEDGSTLYQHSTTNPDFRLDYFFKESAKVAVNGRIFFDTKGSFYIDGRISMFSFIEYLTINKNEVEKNSFKQFAPGFSIGMQPHLSKNVYMNLNFSWDFYKFKDVGFKNGYNLENPYGLTSETHFAPMYSDIVVFKSQIPDRTMTFSVNIGFGYFF